MKDLQQSTVNTVNSVVKPISQATTNAKHKIGDLQDEAAGVVEGIIDFGMAGIRKGLRLTGLQDNFSDLATKSKHEIHKIQKSIDAKANDFVKAIESSPPKASSPQKPSFASKHSSPPKHISLSKHNSPPKPRLTKLSHITSDDRDEKSSSNESDDGVWTNPLVKDSPNFDGHILLERTPITPKTFSMDLAKRLSKTSEERSYEIPLIAMSVDSNGCSPDLEYEDTTDLATTTAKLRSLLQQKTSESVLNTPALSPM